MFKIKNSLFLLIFLLGLLLPDNNISYLIIGFSPILLFLSKTDKAEFQFDKNLLFFFTIITISFIATSISTEGLELKSVTRYFSFSVLFLLFPFSPSLVIPNKVLYFALVIIVLSQLSFVVGLSQIVSLIDTIYPYQGDKLGYDSQYLLGGAGDLDFVKNRRYGGIYRNPNQAVRYISLLFIVYLIENKNNSFVKKIPFIAIVIISILISGSRTGLIVTLILLIYSIYFNQVKINFSKIIIGLALLIGFGLFYSFLSAFDLRVFEMSVGLDNSLGVRFDVFNHFFSNLFSPFKFLFGHFSSDNIKELYGLNHLDSEWGELFYNFGFLGFIALFLFYRKLFLLKDSNIRFFMFILFWGITSTVIFSFKMSFLFMLFLSKYYADYLKSKKDQLVVKEASVN